MITIEQTRELLGAAADGKTDAEVLLIRDQGYALADCVIESILDRHRRLASDAVGAAPDRQEAAS